MKRHLVTFASIALVLAACTSAVASTPAPTMSTPSVPLMATPSPGAPSAGAGPTPLPAGPDIPLAGLTDPAHGWAVTNHRLHGRRRVDLA